MSSSTPLIDRVELSVASHIEDVAADEIARRLGVITEGVPEP